MPLYRLDIEDTHGLYAGTTRNFINLSFNIRIGAKGDYQLIVSGLDTDLIRSFDDDFIVRVWRKDTGDWINVFNGIHKTLSLSYEQNGKRLFNSYGPDSHELLEKTQVLYPNSLPQADKVGIGSNVILEYARENIGAQALQTNGRYRDNVLPVVIVGYGGIGATWAGNWANKNLLELCQDVRDFSIQSGVQLDYEMKYFGGYVWHFRVGNLYTDRTTRGLTNTTHLNGAGNVPVVFSPKHNNVKSFTYSKSRYNESNAVVGLGSGVGTLRETAVLIDGANRTPISARESVVNFQDLTGQALIDGVRTTLRESVAKPNIGFEPILSDIQLWRDLFPGDFITVIDFGGNEYHMQLTGVSMDVSQGEGGSNTIERPNLTFTDINLT